MRKLGFLFGLVFILFSCGETESHDDCVKRYMDEGFSRKEAEHECYEEVNYDTDIRSGT